MTTTEVWYRYEDKMYAGPVNEWGNTTPAVGPYVELRKYPVLHRTPKGVWLEAYTWPYNTNKRFIKAGTNKQFAHPTKEEALSAFILRKRSQAAIHRHKAKIAEQAILIAEMMANPAARVIV